MTPEEEVRANLILGMQRAGMSTDTADINSVLMPVDQISILPDGTETEVGPRSSDHKRPEVWHYSCYRKSSGRIVSNGMGDKNEPMDEGYGCIEGHYSPSEYCVDQSLEIPYALAKTEIKDTLVFDSLSITLGQSVTVSNIPEGLTIHVNGLTAEYITGGQMMVTPETVGIFRLSVDDAAYFLTVWEIEVSD